MIAQTRPALFLLLLLAACDCGNALGEPCLSTADCPTGSMCLDGTCRAPETGGPCATAADCDADSYCIDMVCVPRDTEPGCTDLDGDGRGEGCSMGPDCDDTSRVQTGTEVCDGRDNDCDGVSDEGVLSRCGNCDPLCRAEGFGPPAGMPWDTEGTMSDDESDGVGVDDDGALVLDSRRINTNFIWVANTQEGSVSRFSTTAPYAEHGRYFTGPAVNAGAFFAGNDPSRTSVNSVGDAFIGNRNGNELTRVSVLGTDCPDSNGDGAITTSQDLNGDGVISTVPADGEMLPWGEDDCVLWHKNLDDALPGETKVRAVAAQDLDGLDGALLEYVWVGGHDLRTVAKLDGATGDVILTTPSPVPTYGFALDGDGQLWISGLSDAAIGRIDTTRCVDAASCTAEAICAASGPEATECDGAIRARIPMAHQPYGITVDFNQRVWTGGRNGDVGWYSRYDPTAPGGSRWVNVNQGNPGWVHGIAADASGWVWGALQQSGIARISADDPNTRIVVPGTAGPTNKGMAIDSEGKVWSITQNDYAIVVTPGAAIDANTVETNVAASMRSNYTYSDMTGLQLRLATNPRGFYRHIFEGCPTGGTVAWTDVIFDASVPPGTTLSFRVKTADTRDGLTAAEWIAVGAVPPDASRFSIGDALMAAGVTPQRFLMLEIALRADRVSATEVISPRVMSVDVSHSCEPIIE